MEETPHRGEEEVKGRGLPPPHECEGAFRTSIPFRSGLRSVINFDTLDHLPGGLGGLTLPLKPWTPRLPLGSWDAIRRKNSHQPLRPGGGSSRPACCPRTPLGSARHRTPHPRPKEPWHCDVGVASSRLFVRKVQTQRKAWGSTWQLVLPG